MMVMMIIIGATCIIIMKNTRSSRISSRPEAKKKEVRENDIKTEKKEEEQKENSERAHC